MKQITLSIEQMQNLESLGLDISDASMCYNLTTEGYKLIPHEGALATHIPAYTLQDIQEVLNNASCYIATDYTCIWAEPFNSNERMVEFDSDDMLLNSYRMLLWCIENGHIEIK